VIAIDGPAASGKSSTARAVAEQLGFAHLDSGALYRGVTLVALRHAPPGLPLDSVRLLREAEARGLQLQFDGRGYAVYLGGESADQAIRSPEVTARVSAVAAVPEIREWVTERLRRLARAGQSLVVDGRDIGTVVFPEADLKIFLTASPRTRAGRRITQRGQVVEPTLLERETASLAARDQADSSREAAPLRQAPDAIPLDGTDLSFEEQVARICALARDRLAHG
jgi:cytidylate kinase